MRAIFVDTRSTPFMNCDCGQSLDFMPDDSDVVFLLCCIHNMNNCLCYNLYAEYANKRGRRKSVAHRFEAWE